MIDPGEIALCGAEGEAKALRQKDRAGTILRKGPHTRYTEGATRGEEAHVLRGISQDKNGGTRSLFTSKGGVCAFSHLESKKEALIS